MNTPGVKREKLTEPSYIKKWRKLSLLIGFVVILLATTIIGIIQLTPPSQPSTANLLEEIDIEDSNIIIEANEEIIAIPPEEIIRTQYNSCLNNCTDIAPGDLDGGQCKAYCRQILSEIE